MAIAKTKKKGINKSGRQQQLIKNYKDRLRSDPSYMRVPRACIRTTTTYVSPPTSLAEDIN
jgi:hypothetical protein